jgi:hypothetical protein
VRALPTLPPLRLTGAGASDATFHLLWVVLFNAVDEFGVREANDALGAGGPPELEPPDARAQRRRVLADVEAAKDKLFDEALHGALRIAGLAGVLASNGYLVRLSAPPPAHIRC